MFLDGMETDSNFTIEIVFYYPWGFQVPNYFVRGTELYSFLCWSNFLCQQWRSIVQSMTFSFNKQNPFDVVRLNYDLNLNTHKLLSISLHADYLQRALPRHWATYGVPCRLHTLMLLSLHTSTKQSENEIVFHFVWN